MCRLASVALNVIPFPEEYVTIKSKIESASRRAPSAFWEIKCNASSSAGMDSCCAIFFKWWAMSAICIRLKSNIWHLDKMVGITLCFSVVASIKIAYDGGSSSVFKKALNAWLESMCTSSMIYTLNFPNWGG